MKLTRFSNINKLLYLKPNKPIQNHNLLQPLVFAIIKQCIVFSPKTYEGKEESPIENAQVKFWKVIYNGI